jgi:hypothetical protein
MYPIPSENGLRILGPLRAAHQAAQDIEKLLPGTQASPVADPRMRQIELPASHLRSLREVVPHLLDEEDLKDLSGSLAVDVSRVRPDREHDQVERVSVPCCLTFKVSLAWPGLQV